MDVPALQLSLASVFNTVASNAAARGIFDRSHFEVISSAQGVEFLSRAEPLELSRALSTAQLLGATIPENVARWVRSSANKNIQPQSPMIDHIRDAWWQAQAILGGGWGVFQVDPNQIQFIPESGGFPQIVHGGVTTYAGLVALGLQSPSTGFDPLNQPTKILGKIDGRVTPGDAVTWRGKPATNGASVVMGEGKVTVMATSLKLASPADLPDYAPEVLAKKDGAGQFHCLPSCVAFGTENPHGLHLTGHFLTPDEASPPSLLFEVWPQGVPSILPLMAAADELSFWMIAAWSRKMGVTPKIEMEWWRHPAPGESVAVVVLPPNSNLTYKLIRTTAYVVTEKGEVLARSHVTFITDSGVAHEGMGGLEMTTVRPFMQRFGISF